MYQLIICTFYLFEGIFNSKLFNFIVNFAISSVFSVLEEMKLFGADWGWGVGGGGGGGGRLRSVYSQ